MVMAQQVPSPGFRHDTRDSTLSAKAKEGFQGGAETSNSDMSLRALQGSQLGCDSKRGPVLNPSKPSLPLAVEIHLDTFLAFLSPILNIRALHWTDLCSGSPTQKLPTVRVPIPHPLHHSGAHSKGPHTPPLHC